MSEMADILTYYRNFFLFSPIIWLYIPLMTMLEWSEYFAPDLVKGILSNRIFTLIRSAFDAYLLEPFSVVTYQYLGDFFGFTEWSTYALW